MATRNYNFTTRGVLESVVCDRHGIPPTTGLICLAGATPTDRRALPVLPPPALHTIYRRFCAAQVPSVSAAARTQCRTPPPLTMTRRWKLYVYTIL